MADSKYRVVLLDSEGGELGERPGESLREAMRQMNYLLSDAYALAADTTHARLGSFKAEVRNAAGECVRDGFLVPRTPCGS